MMHNLAKIFCHPVPAKTYWNKIRLAIMFLLFPLCLYAADNDNKKITIKDLFRVQPKPSFASQAGINITSGSGTISYAQFFFYSDSTCTTLIGSGTAGASTVDNVNTLSVSGPETIFIDPTSLYNFADNQGITVANVQCIKLYLDAGNDATFGGIDCQTFQDIVCSGSTCLSDAGSPTNNATWNTSPSFCNGGDRNLYIPNSDSGPVGICPMTGGSIGASVTCTAASNYAGSPPRTASISNNIAYMLNGPFGTLCPVLTNNSGDFSTCSNLASNPGNSATQVVFNGSHAYIVNNDTNDITVCDVAANGGDLTSCTTTSTTLSNPYNMVIVNGYAYIANFGTTIGTGGSITRCLVSTVDGTLSGCSQVQTGLPNPVSLTTYNGYLYFGLWNNVISSGNAIWSCPITSPGVVGTCTAALSNINEQVNGMVAYNNFMYVAGGSATFYLLRCDFGVSGALNCNTQVSITGFTLNDPRVISVY